MGEPAKKVNLDQILREKVEASKFTYSDEHWDRLSGELAKQNNKKAAKKGIILFLQNRWVQSGLVAAVAVFATYFYMSNYSANATEASQNTTAEAPLKTTPNPQNSSTLTPADNQIAEKVIIPSIDKEDENTSNNQPPLNSKTFIAPVKQEKDTDKAPEIREPKLKRDILEVQNITPLQAHILNADTMSFDKLALDNNHFDKVDSIKNNDELPDKHRTFAFNGIGIKTGTSIAPTYTGATNSFAYGSTVGLFSNFSLTRRTSLQAEVLFTQVKGHRIERVETSGQTIYNDNGVPGYNFTGRHVTVSGLNYFRFPVLIKYEVIPKVSIGAGGYYSRLESPLGEDREFQYNDVPIASAGQGFAPTSNATIDRLHNEATTKSLGGVATQASGIKQWDAGILIEAEVSVKRWRIGARFNQGLSDITPNEIYGQNGDTAVYKTNTSVEATIGFLF